MYVRFLNMNTRSNDRYEVEAVNELPDVKVLTDEELREEAERWGGYEYVEGIEDAACVSDIPAVDNGEYVIKEIRLRYLSADGEESVSYKYVALFVPSDSDEDEE